MEIKMIKLYVNQHIKTSTKKININIFYVTEQFFLEMFDNFTFEIIYLYCCVNRKDFTLTFVGGIHIYILDI